MTAPLDPVLLKACSPASKMACLAISSRLGGVGMCPHGRRFGATTSPSVFTRALIPLLKAESSQPDEALNHKQMFQP